MFCFLLQLQEKILLAQKFHLNFIGNIISLHYFLELGCGSLFYYTNQGRRQNPYYQVRLTHYSRKASQHQTKKRVYSQLARQNLGANETPFERAYFGCISGKCNHTVLAFLRRL